MFSYHSLKLIKNRWYYCNHKQGKVTHGFITQEEAYEYVEENVLPEFQHYYAGFEPLTKWLREGVKKEFGVEE